MSGKSGKNIANITQALKNRKNKKLSQTARAGLVFSVARTRRMLKSHSPEKRLTTTSSVYLASVVEYLLAEILELAGNACRDNRKKLITPRFIQLAVKNDDEFCQLLKHVTIIQGGVLPYVHPQLLPKKGQAKREYYDEI
ncbi:histone-fold-containing protein [Gymnopus androsaceus JB14]|uniref:Histone H2A n=1 Tax=Gymnopus androsaceus JB14 TaxID=1447944 RepID=A0A6A4H2B0_9AGAR|nr:histone-fold-containing protein [Gymnopus androsaceus JB14]